ncbi:LuxR family two component transcriptional regulator [Actinokineospora spheciospongiae]|nr:LuxR family two component transcriptional regulator [Actinokineospora spheciospongiae]
MRVVTPPGDTMTGMRVVIAEDSVLLRVGVTRLLADEGIETVAAVEDGSGLLDAVLEHRPDLAIVDVRMPPTFTDEGLRAALGARERVPGLPVLVLSQYVEERYAVELLAAGTGGVGYLLKERVADVAEFVDAVRRVAGGGTSIDQEVIAQLMARGRRNPVDALTPREREVLGLMAQGLSNAAIARSLTVSDGAVEKHVGNIFAKLNLEPSSDEHRRVRAVLTFLERA